MNDEIDCVGDVMKAFASQFKTIKSRGIQWEVICLDTFPKHIRFRNLETDDWMSIDDIDVLDRRLILQGIDGWFENNEWSKQ